MRALIGRGCIGAAFLPLAGARASSETSFIPPPPHHVFGDTRHCTVLQRVEAATDHPLSLSSGSILAKADNEDSATMNNNVRVVDVGINLTHKAFRKNWREVVQRAVDARVSTMLLTGTSVESSRQSLNLAQEWLDETGTRNLYATVGIHPHDAKMWNENTLEQMRELLTHPLAVAVGECGLDFNRNFSSREDQLRAFRVQVGLAVELDKPLFVHEREAHTDLVKVLDEWKGEELPPIVVHCFTGEKEEALEYVRRGYYVGFTGTICKKERGAPLRELLPSLPLERIPTRGVSLRGWPANWYHTCCLVLNMTKKKTLDQIVSGLKQKDSSYDEHNDVRLGVKGKAAIPPAEERFLDECKRQLPAHTAAGSNEEKNAIIDRLISSVQDDGGRFFTGEMVPVTGAALQKMVKKKVEGVRQNKQKESAALFKKLDTLTLTAEDVTSAKQLKEAQDLPYSEKTIYLREILSDDTLGMSLKKDQLASLQAKLEELKTDELVALVDSLVLSDCHEDNDKLFLVLQILLEKETLPAAYQNNAYKRSAGKLADLRMLESTYLTKKKLAWNESNLVAARAAGIHELAKESLEGDGSKKSRQLLNALELEVKEKKSLAASEKQRKGKQQKHMILGRTMDEWAMDAMADFETMQFGVKPEGKCMFSYP